MLSGEQLALNAMQKEYKRLCYIADKAKQESDEYLNVGTEMINIHEEFATIVKAGEHGRHVLDKLDKLKRRSDKCNKIRTKDFLKLNDKEVNSMLERDRLGQEIATLQFRIDIRRKQYNEVSK